MIRLLLMCSLLFMLGGCSVAPVIPLQLLPAPAMEKMPVHVALITDDAFRNYNFEGPLFSGPWSADAMMRNDRMLETFRLHIELGKMNVDLFSQVSSSLFAQVSRFDSMEELKASGESFDGVLVPALEHFNAGQGADQPVLFADVTYELLFFDQHEQQILDWKVVSEQLFCQAENFCHFDHKDIMLAAEREIAAKVLSQFPGFPEITEWVNSVEANR